MKKNELDTIRYHWYSYVARGGVAKPKKFDIGVLQEGGLKHWTLFLRTARTYLEKYPKNRYELEIFVPEKLVKMLVGE